ncbi:hypothetical protein QTO34_014386 [Cnephaeus nilssonii]|uniref:Rho-GAP domain-containing protein n=1 Tax=Cnephaeus nilssonii TaxID=3371016 RepID=A0AA40LU09_CNENI|nr:hypothetical protein QTO34_014386 [Eptesicus nilssonii]
MTSYGSLLAKRRHHTVHSQHKNQRIPPGLPTSESPFLIEQLSWEVQGQFTLQPRCLVQPCIGEIYHKLGLWVGFWHSSGKLSHVTNLFYARTALSVPVPSICEDDNRPKLVSHMLFLSLNLKGPLTKGLFRQSSNVKSPRELKEKLNSRVEVHLDCESVFVLASVLKVFLQNIPGSIFSSDSIITRSMFWIKEMMQRK